ncbi:hypothetical protein F5H01DRAFT_358405 [Linnemannia elongata]|nr:hypothetical protein F5H01DRAFT_358405 [Linnemannia elongata]
MPNEKTTVTSIVWPPVKETHIVTAAINGVITSIPASQTANITLFPSNMTTTTTTTKPPPTTVFGVNPPPPYVSGSPTAVASSSADGNGKSTAWRNWGLVIMAAVILSIIGGLVLKRYRAGREKKQEPGNFVSVGEDDGESEQGVGGGSGTGGSVGFTTIGHGQGQGQGQGGQSQLNQTSNNNVRERRNSQPIPRSLDLDGPLRS